ncbi:MAG: M28 family peptidase [Bacteroidetes bacterium]|nr:M28 family peptidase [Bacteroidota bacterium]
MKKRFIQIFFILIFCVSNGLAQNREISIQYLQSNLEFLASDELEGREVTTRGEKIASLFIAQELKKYGIKPFGDNGSFYQNFNLMVITNDKNNTVLKIENGKDNNEELKFNDEFLLSKSPMPHELYSNKKYKVVFAGFGVESDRDNYSSYKNIDVSGKIVVVLPGTPLESQNHFGLMALKKLKENIASQKGAAAIIHLLGTETALKWPMIKFYMTSPTFKLENEFESPNKKNIPSIIVSNKGAEKIFINELLTYDKIDSVFKVDGIKACFELDKEIYLSYDFIKEIKPARNVVGILEGTDDILKQEFVTIGAHYDHLGAYNGNVFNGADDNGSGTVSVLELARLLAIEKTNKRSIVFAFHTGEEKGLLGAKYLTEHSDNLIKNAVVNINLDMIGRESIDTIFSVGSGRISSELLSLIEEINSQTVNFVLDYKFDQPNDPQNIYNRSDHKHYADKGIPVVFFFDEMNEDYHKPTDTIEKINFNKIYKVTELSKAIVNKIANLNHKLKTDNNNELNKDRTEGKIEKAN